MWACAKHTHYRILGLLSFIACHMVDLAIHVILLPLWLCFISFSRNYQSGQALPCKMTSQPTFETSSIISASLSWCILRGWSGWARALMHVLARLLLHIWARCLLLRLLHLDVRMLCLKVQSLHLEWRMLSMHRWMNHTQVSKERPWLRQARLGVASWRLPQEWHFPLAILIHLFDLVLNNYSLVDHPLKILVVDVEKLELNLVIESI
jgi:hypothetical protein